MMTSLQLNKTPQDYKVNYLLHDSAKRSVKDGPGSVWQHGNFNTSQLRKLSSYNDETVHIRDTNTLLSLVGIRPLGVAPHIREITLLVICLPPFLPAFFSCVSALVQTDRDNFAHNGAKDVVWRKEVASQLVLLL